MAFVRMQGVPVGVVLAIAVLLCSVNGSGEELTKPDEEGTEDLVGDGQDVGGSAEARRSLSRQGLAANSQGAGLCRTCRPTGNTACDNRVQARNKLPVHESLPLLFQTFRGGSERGGRPGGAT